MLGFGVLLWFFNLFPFSWRKLGKIAPENLLPQEDVS